MDYILWDRRECTKEFTELNFFSCPVETELEGKLRTIHETNSLDKNCLGMAGSFRVDKMQIDIFGGRAFRPGQISHPCIVEVKIFGVDKNYQWAAPYSVAANYVFNAPLLITHNRSFFVNLIFKDRAMTKDISTLECRLYGDYNQLK